MPAIRNKMHGIRDAVWLHSNFNHVGLHSLHVVPVISEVLNNYIFKHTKKSNEKDNEIIFNQQEHQEKQYVVWLTLFLVNKFNNYSLNTNKKKLNK